MERSQLILGTASGLRANGKVPQGSDMSRAPWSSFLLHWGIITVQTSYWEGLWHQNWVRSRPKQIFTRATLIILGTLSGPLTHYLAKPFHPRSVNKVCRWVKTIIQVRFSVSGSFCLGKDSIWRRPFWWWTFIPFLGPVEQLYQSSYSILRLKYGHFISLFQTNEGGRQNNSTWAIEESYKEWPLHIVELGAKWEISTNTFEEMQTTKYYNRQSLSKKHSCWPWPSQNRGARLPSCSSARSRRRRGRRRSTLEGQR